MFFDFIRYSKRLLQLGPLLWTLQKEIAHGVFLSNYGIGNAKTSIIIGSVGIAVFALFCVALIVCPRRQKIIEFVKYNGDAQLSTYGHRARYLSLDCFHIQIHLMQRRP